VTEIKNWVNGYLEKVKGFDGLYPEYSLQLRFLPGSEISTDHPIFPHLQRAYAAAGREYVVRGAPFASDGYVFNLYSATPVVTIGVGGDNAHAPNEFIYLQDLVDLTRIFARTIASWCA